MRRLGEASPNDYHFTDVAELDITDKEAILAYGGNEGFDAIVNCAAYTAVDRAEDDEATAELINATAVRNLAEAAKVWGATLFHVSTDYVFSGEGNTPRSEEMPTAPLGAYGRTKLRGEQAIAEVGCKALIFRTAWLYSEYGGNFLKTMLRLTAERPHLSVVVDQVGTPTYAGDLAMTIFAIIERDMYDGKEGVYHFSNEGVCSWYDFAVEIARAAGNVKCEIHPCSSEEFPSKVKRPHYSVLDKTKIKREFGVEIPHWRESMLYCLKRLSNKQ
jgi:dTDP-4-dehydrorhamnose reductase